MRTSVASRKSQKASSHILLTWSLVDCSAPRQGLRHGVGCGACHSHSRSVGTPIFLALSRNSTNARQAGGTVFASIVLLPHLIPLPIWTRAPTAPPANALLLAVDVPGFQCCLFLFGARAIGVLLLHCCCGREVPRPFFMPGSEEDNSRSAGVIVRRGVPTPTTLFAGPSLCRGSTGADVWELQLHRSCCIWQTDDEMDSLSAGRTPREALPAGTGLTARPSGVPRDLHA